MALALMVQALMAIIMYPFASNAIGMIDFVTPDFNPEIIINTTPSNAVGMADISIS